MSLTRREFLVSTAAALSTAAVAAPHDDAVARPDVAAPCAGEPAWIVGDPYTASACAAGFGGRSFTEACEYALRFRTPADDRDRLVLGLEL
ncbi:MAG: hypothetical protein ACRD15_07215 [Vicinamibacterales bacterium]